MASCCDALMPPQGGCMYSRQAPVGEYLTHHVQHRGEAWGPAAVHDFMLQVTSKGIKLHGSELTK